MATAKAQARRNVARRNVTRCTRGEGEVAVLEETLTTVKPEHRRRIVRSKRRKCRTTPGGVVQDLRWQDKYGET